MAVEDTSNISKEEHSKYFRSKGVRLKLLLSFVLLISVTTLIMVGLAYNSTRNLASERMMEKMETLASVFSLEIEQDISKTIDILQEASSDPENRSLIEEKPASHFDTRLKRLKLDAVYVFNRNGVPIYMSNYSRGHLAMSKGLFLIPEVDRSMSGEVTLVTQVPIQFNHPGGIFIIVPITDDEDVTGVLIAEKTLDSSIMEKAVQNPNIAGEEMKVFLLDKYGAIIAHTDKAMISRSMFDSGMPLFEYGQENNQNQMIEEIEKEFKFFMGDRKHISSTAVVDERLGWRVMLIQPYDLAFAPVRRVVLQILAIGALALVVGVGLALYRSNRIIKPIGQLLIAVEDITRGDYSRSVKVYKRDEIGSLAIAFNQMKTALQEQIRNAKDYQARLEEAYNQLQNDARKREEANRELSRKVKELTSLSEVTQTITNSLDLDEVLDTIIDAISRVMGFQICSIKLIDKMTGRLKVEKERGLGEEYIENSDTRVGEGVTGLAVKMCKPIIIEDVDQDPRVPKDHIVIGYGVKSIISIPLITKQSVMGALNLYTKNKHVFTEDEKRLLGIFANQAAGAIENARLFETLRESYLNTIQALSMAIDAKDRYTHGHSKRVRDISSMIGREMGLPDDQLELLEYSADLHDIGKIGISEMIISKEGKLTVEEYELIKTHPLVGETIIEPVPFLQDVKPIIRHHHERWDGFGYPDGLAGEEIPLLSRIILIADAYDAMTSDRPYRRALSQDEAMREILKHKDAQFDPRVVDALVEVFKKISPEDVAAS